MSGLQDLPDLGASVARLAVAILLAVPIGWDRAHRSRSAGLRTYPLVAVATCGFVLVGWSALGPTPEEHADVVYGILTGLGFIGSGALLRNPDGNRGMATMVSLWVTTAIGIAAAYGLILLALAISLLTLVALKATRPRGKGTSDER